MSNLKQMDVEAGYAAVNAMTSHSDFIEGMFTTLTASMDNLIGTWHGSSKTQFESTWAEYVSAVTQIKQQLQTIQANLQTEVQSVEEVFSV